MPAHVDPPNGPVIIDAPYGITCYYCAGMLRLSDVASGTPVLSYKWDDPEGRYTTRIVVLHSRCTQPYWRVNVAHVLKSM